MHIKTILILTFLSFVVLAKAQDRIITTQNDTINCKISKVTSSNIIFSLKTGNVLTKGKIDRNKVLSYSSENNRASDNLEIATQDSSRSQSVLSGRINNLDYAAQGPGRWRLGLSGGINYLTASSSEAESNLVQQGADKQAAEAYYNDLKLGQNIGADLHYMINKTYGIGLVYKLYSNNSLMETFFDPQDGVNVIFGKIHEKIFVNYGGISLYSEQFMKANPRWKWSSYCSAGMSFYRDEAVIINTPVLLTGKAFATNLDFGLEYFVFPKISAGINLSYFLSSLKKITFNDGNTTLIQELDKKHYENISRVDLSVGIRFYR